MKLFTIKERLRETLNLPVKKKWYEMIESGIKREEYREINKYWHSRIAYCFKWCCGMYFKKFDASDFDDAENIGNRGYCQECENVCHFERINTNYRFVRIRCGYTKKYMDFIIKQIKIGVGKEEWGAEPGKRYFVIVLGERLQ